MLFKMRFHDDVGPLNHLFHEKLFESLKVNLEDFLDHIHGEILLVYRIFRHLVPQAAPIKIGIKGCIID